MGTCVCTHVDVRVCLVMGFYRESIAALALTHLSAQATGCFRQSVSIPTGPGYFLLHNSKFVVLIWLKINEVSRLKKNHMTILKILLFANY